MLLLLLGPLVAAQQYEVGGAVGYGFYRNGDLFSPDNGTAAVGIHGRTAGSFVFGEDEYEYISGEIRYVYESGRPFIRVTNRTAPQPSPSFSFANRGKGEPVLNWSGGDQTDWSDIRGRSHSFDYSLLFHFRSVEDRVRPFVSVGAGAKYYVIVSDPPYPQPWEFGSLMATDQWKFLVTAGVGVKWKLTPHTLVRLDIRDYMTGFPRRQIAPAPGNKLTGVFHDIMPMFGLSYLF